MKKHGKTVAILTTVFTLGAAQALASEKPPTNAVPLSEIASSLENQGYSPIVEMEIDDGVWKVEAYRANTKRELRINPISGEILSDKLDD